MGRHGGVTDYEELAPLTDDDTLDGYLPEERNATTALAARVDATDTIFFEGALVGRPGGVVRVEPSEAVDDPMPDLGHVLPGHYVAGVESLMFWHEGEIEDAIDDGQFTEAEWDRMSEAERVAFLDERRAAFQRRNHIKFDVGRATRIELVAVDRPN